MASRARVALVLLLVATTALPAHAGLLGDLWDGVKSVASAPFKAAGWLVGQGVDAAVDPALDNAFGRLKDTTDHAINRLDSVSQARVSQLDDVAKKRSEQLDEVAKKRIEQVDEVLKNRLDQTDRILDKQLNHLEAIGTQLLDREAKILDENVTRVEDILDRSLDRLQEMETDAFDRIDAALQDQVPYAASQVARTVEWTAAVIVFLVVLVGFGGVSLLRRIQADASTKPIWAKLKENLVYVPRSLLLVGVPMLFLFAVIQVGYYAYCNRADAARIARLEDAADILERAGDFKAAISFRKRAFALDGEPKRNYMVIRDQWLAGFWQRHIGQDTVELIQRLIYLRTEPTLLSFSESDLEIQAAALYLRVNYGAKAVGDDETKRNETTLASDIQAYKKQFVSQKTKPVLGKLVFMAEARRTLNDGSLPIAKRLESVSQIVDSLLSKEHYPRYASGLVLRSQVSVHLLELGRDQLKPSVDGPEIEARRKEIEKAVLNAYAADPNLARYVRFRASSLPTNENSTLRKNLQLWHSTEVDKRKDLKDAQERLLSETISKQLDEFASDLQKTIDPLLGVDVLSRAKVERQILHAMRASLGEEQLAKDVQTARDIMKGPTKPDERYKACVAVAETASGLGKLQLAEAWYEVSAGLVTANEGAFANNEASSIATKLDDVRKRAGYAEVAVQPGQEPAQTPSVTDVMFFVF
jgi:hypothetical protein